MTALDTIQMTATADHPLGCIRGLMFAAPVSLALYALIWWAL